MGESRLVKGPKTPLWRDENEPVEKTEEWCPMM